MTTLIWITLCEEPTAPICIFPTPLPRHLFRTEPSSQHDSSNLGRIPFTEAKGYKPPSDYVLFKKVYTVRNRQI
jgi:hypothetical protein